MQTQTRIIVWRRDPKYVWSIERRRDDSPAYIGPERRQVITQADEREREPVAAAAT